MFFMIATLASLRKFTTPEQKTKALPLVKLEGLIHHSCQARESQWDIAQLTISCLRQYLKTEQKCFIGI